MTATAVFDLDGTLVDSAPDIAAAVNEALARSGRAPLPVPQVIGMVGNGARRLVERALAAHDVSGDEAAVEAMLSAFESAYHLAPCRETRIYPGAEQTLACLKSDGWRLAICTNKPQRLALDVISGLGLMDYFDAVVGGRDGVPLKPAAEMVRVAFEEAGAEDRRGVMIGDSRADLGAGRSAGIPVILVSHGYSDVAVSELGADATVGSLEGAAAVIKKIIMLER